MKAQKIFEMLSSSALPSAFLPSNGLVLVSTQGFIRLDMSEFQERHEVSESPWGSLVWMAWSWASAPGLELRRRHCVTGRRWGAVGRDLGVLGRELPALWAPVLGPWVCGPCGRSEISLSLGWIPGQRLGPGDVVPTPSTWDSGGEKAAWARGACQFVTLKRRGMA